MATMTISNAAPERSLEQRRQALRKANAIRSARAEIKRDIKARHQSPAVLLAQPPATLDTMKVFDLLLAVPKVGRVKVQKMLASVPVSPSKTVGGLSPRQREELLALIRPYGRGSEPSFFHTSLPTTTERSVT